MAASPLPRPDALPVRPGASHAVLPEAMARVLFGTALRGSERVEIVRLGRICATVPVSAGSAARLVLSAQSDVEPDGLRLRGPVGTAAAPAPEAVASRLVLPAGLIRAWGIGTCATLAVGSVAVRAGVAAGIEAGVEVDRALWLVAGRPETARWLPGMDWDDDTPAAAPTEPTVLVVARRVVTETDVRQAKLRHLTIRLTAGQVVTPAAQSLAREWGVFEVPEAAQPGPRVAGRSWTVTPS